MLLAAQGLALTRMGFGLYLLSQAWGELSGGWLASGAQMSRQIQFSLQRGTEGFYRPFLEQVVLPNQDLFAQLVALGEIAAGLSLVLGLFTRVGSVLGMSLVTNYMLE